MSPYYRIAVAPKASTEAIFHPVSVNRHSTPNVCVKKASWFSATFVPSGKIVTSGSGTPFSSVERRP